MAGASGPSVTHRHAAGGTRGTFDLGRGGKRVGFLSYSLAADGTMIVEYVEVDPSLRGKSMGVRLVAAAVDWARANGHRIVPLCSYARAVLERTPEYQDVLKAR